MVDKENKRLRGWVGWVGSEHPTSKQVIQMELGGKSLRGWESMRKASKHLHIDIGNISKACKNKRKSAGNFKWRYRCPTLQKVWKMDLNGEIIKGYNTIIVASKKNSIPESEILDCCLGRLYVAGGFKWKF